MNLRLALRLWALGEPIHEMSYNNMVAATERIHRLMQHREWDRRRVYELARRQRDRAAR